MPPRSWPFRLALTLLLRRRRHSSLHATWGTVEVVSSFRDTFRVGLYPPERSRRLDRGTNLCPCSENPAVKLFWRRMVVREPTWDS